MSVRWSSHVAHHPARKAFQCKRIPDDLMICAVLLASGALSDQPHQWRMRHEVEHELRQLLGESAPVGLAKVMMAKFAKMERRGILHGCTCGCRGDYHLPGKSCC